MKIEIDGIEVIYEDVRPVSGDFYIYIWPDSDDPSAPKLQVLKANWPPGWMNRCWDRDNYFKVTHVNAVYLYLTPIDRTTLNKNT